MLLRPNTRHYYKYLQEQDKWIKCGQSEWEVYVDTTAKPLLEVHNRFHSGWDRRAQVESRLSGTEDIDRIPQQICADLSLSKEWQLCEDAKGMVLYQDLFYNTERSELKAKVDELKRLNILKFGSIASRSN